MNRKLVFPVGLANSLDTSYTWQNKLNIMENIYLIEVFDKEKWVLLAKIEDEAEALKSAEVLNKTLHKPVRTIKCTVSSTVVFDK